MSVKNKDMRHILRCSDLELTELKLAFKRQMEEVIVNTQPFTIQIPNEVDANGALRRLMWENVAASNRALGDMLSGRRWKSNKPADFDRRVNAVKTKIRLDHTNEARRSRPKDLCVRDEDETAEDSTIDNEVDPNTNRLLRKRKTGAHGAGQASPIDLVSAEDDDDDEGIMLSGDRRAAERRATQSPISSTKSELRKRARVSRNPEKASRLRRSGGSEDVASRDGNKLRVGERDTVMSDVEVDEIMGLEAPYPTESAQQSSRDTEMSSIAVNGLVRDPRFLAENLPKKIMARRGWHGLRPAMDVDDHSNAVAASDRNPDISFSTGDSDDCISESFDGAASGIYVEASPGKKASKSLEARMERTTQLGMEAGVTSKMAAAKERLSSPKTRFGKLGTENLHELTTGLDEVAPVYTRAPITEVVEAEDLLTSLTRKIIRFYVADEMARVRAQFEDKLMEMGKRVEGMKVEIRQEILAELGLH